MKTDINIFTLILSIMLLQGGSFPAFAQRDTAEIYQAGQQHFRTYCNSCHGVHQAKLGPMLASITHKRTEEWLISFILNSQEVIISGDEYANHLFEQYHHVVMPSFNKHLSEQEIRDILLFIDKASDNPTPETGSYPAVNELSNENVMKGKAIFNDQCASCHFIYKDGYGPSLGSVPNRRPIPWLVSFIKNSQQVIKSGDEYAVHLYNSYDQKVMPSFEYLSEEEILTTLDFIAFASEAAYPVAGTNGRIDQPGVIGQPVSSNREVQEANQEKSIPFKIMLIVFSLMGASVHVFIIVKLFLYLKRGDYSKA